MPGVMKGLGAESRAGVVFLCAGQRGEDAGFKSAGVVPAPLLDATAEQRSSHDNSLRRQLAWLVRFVSAHSIFSSFRSE